MKSSSYCLQLEKNPHSNKDPAQSKLNFKKDFKEKWVLKKKKKKKSTFRFGLISKIVRNDKFPEECMPKGKQNIISNPKLRSI